MLSVVRLCVRYPALRVLVVVSGLLGLSGCKLVDQKTFNPQAGKAPKPYIPPPLPGPPPIPPLVELVEGTPANQWQKPVKQIVQTALARKPNILFIIKCLVPPSGNSETDQAKLVELVRRDGQAIAQAMIDAGAVPEQVEITAMPDSAVTKPLIRVYVN